MTERQLVRKLLDQAGQTYADQAGIRLTNSPAPLYRLLVLSMLLSTRISAEIAVDAARELISAGYGTPRKMLKASWQDRVDALGRAHYVRYDESTATALADVASRLLDQYQGDLRRLREQAGGDVEHLRKLLKEFKRIGDVGADIFCREVQNVWPELRPYFGKKALAGARRLGLPADPGKLAALGPGNKRAQLAAALIRVSLDQELARAIRSK